MIGIKYNDKTQREILKKLVSEFNWGIYNFNTLDMRRYERVMQHQHAHNLQEYLYSVGNVII